MKIAVILNTRLDDSEFQVETDPHIQLSLLNMVLKLPVINISLLK